MIKAEIIFESEEDYEHFLAALEEAEEEGVFESPFSVQRKENKTDD